MPNEYEDTRSTISEPKDGNEDGRQDELTSALKIWPYLYLSGIADFKVRSDDIFLTSYMKSGTTWTANIVSLILDWDDTREESTHLFHNVIHLEMTQGHDLTKASTLPGLYELAKDIKSPRVLKTHLRLNFLPREIEEKRPKIIYVARNPKDVAVSRFHFAALCSNCKTFDNWSGFLDSFYRETRPMHGWFDHVTSFWKYRQDHDNLLYLKYEDMHKNLRDTIVEIANFLERPLSEDAIDEIVDKSRFDAMKSNPRVNPDYEIVCMAEGLKSDKSFMRKGIVGDWKNYFTVAQNETFNTIYEEKMKGSDLTFDFTL